MALDLYLKSFSRLRTDKNRKRWSALTTYQAPTNLFSRYPLWILLPRDRLPKTSSNPPFNCSIHSTRIFHEIFSSTIKKL